MRNLGNNTFILEQCFTIFVVALIPTIILVFLHILEVVMYIYNTTLLLAWVVETCTIYLYIYNFSSITKYLFISFLFLLLTSSKTSRNIILSEAMCWEARNRITGESVKYYLIETNHIEREWGASLGQITILWIYLL